MNKADGSAHQGHYKANSLKTQDSRMRHHEVTIELRTSKKEDHMFMRRNINDEDLTSLLKEVNDQSPVQLSVDEIVIAMNSKDQERQLLGMQQAGKMLSRKRNPPIDLMIGHGIVPICISFLQNTGNTMLQIEAAWALTNIASGTSEQTRCVIEQDAVPHFIALLQSKSINLAKMAVYALGNIAGDGAASRDIVIHNNVIDSILPLINNDTPISFLRNIVWLMSNLCRNKNPSPPFEQVKRLLPVLSQLLLSQDIQVLATACWALSYVTDNDNHKIQAVVDTDAVPKLVNLLKTDDPSIIVPALRCVGNIVTGTDQQTDVVIASNGLPKLFLLLQHPKDNIAKEAARTVSNIRAGNQKQIQAVIDAILKPFIDLLDAKDPRTIKVVQTGLFNLFAFAEEMGDTENLCLMLEELGGLDKLEALQLHENEEVNKKAYAIIDTYFNTSDDEAEQKLAPQVVNGAFEFNATQLKAPEGGYSF